MRAVLRALGLTAATVAAWIAVVRYHDQPRDHSTCVVAYVYDGDTVELRCGARKVTARLVGLDAPETRDAACEREHVAGKDATERLRSLIAKGGVAYSRRGVDKYGRWLIRLQVGGEDVADTLIREELAVPYRGGARIDWCEKLQASAQNFEENRYV